MNVCITYYSKFGNGVKCVEYVGESLKKKGNQVELLSVKAVKPDSLPSADLYIFSSPTRFGRPSGKMKKFLKELKIGNAEAKYALMGTFWEGQSKTIDILSQIMDEKGMTRACEGVLVKVGKIKGPLADDYQKTLDSFVEKLS